MRVNKKLNVHSIIIGPEQAAIVKAHIGSDWVLVKRHDATGYGCGYIKTQN